MQQRPRVGVTPEGDRAACTRRQRGPGAGRPAQSAEIRDESGVESSARGKTLTKGSDAKFETPRMSKNDQTFRASVTASARGVFCIAGALAVKITIARRSTLLKLFPRLSTAGIVRPAGPTSKFRT